MADSKIWNKIDLDDGTERYFIERALYAWE